MAAAPRHVRVRSYNVGFGDCFLVTFTYARATERHVLIDFGSTKASPSGPDLPTIAGLIRDHCGGKLDMVVATHRHADHINGFGEPQGAMIAALDPELVVQPWTEDPDLAPDARAPAAPVPVRPRSESHALVASLADMQAVARAVRDQIPAFEASPSVRKTVREQLAFLGETNIANDDAVRNLMTMGKQRVYASFGTKLPLDDVLPGVGIDVLGPPTLEQSAKIQKQRSSDPGEFWQLTASRAGALSAARGGPKPIFPDAAVAATIPQEARWVIPELERMRSEEVLAIVRVLDSVLNNTSLILLFEVGETRLLFPGDAQIENWSYALFTAPNKDEILKRLATARLYKVGHHGSRNATPKTLWNNFAHRGPEGAPERLETVLSTLAGKHGSVDRGTEVPRKALVQALKANSNLHDTEGLKKALPWNDVDLDL